MFFPSNNKKLVYDWGEVLAPWLHCECGVRKFVYLSTLLSSQFTFPSEYTVSQLLDALWKPTTVYIAQIHGTHTQIFRLKQAETQEQPTNEFYRMYFFLVKVFKNVKHLIAGTTFETAVSAW